MWGIERSAVREVVGTGPVPTTDDRPDGDQTTGEIEEFPLSAAECVGTCGDCPVRIGHERVVDVADIFEFDTFIRIEQGYTGPIRYLREAHNALSVFSAGTTSLPSAQGSGPRRTRRPSTTSATRWLSNSGWVSAGARRPPRGWRRNTHSNTAARKIPSPTSVSETPQTGFSAPLSKYNT